MIEFNKRNARSWSIMGINPSIWSIGFAEIIKGNDDVLVFTADLERYSGLERIFKNYPSNCYNFGIAEQNMVGAAAGMAMEGLKPYLTTYAPFMVYRCYDQIRHFMGNLSLNMKAIGSAAGLTAGLSGLSLLALNDMALMRTIPGVITLSPADCTEAIKMIFSMSETNAPVYMRFCGATNIPIVYTQDYDFRIGKAVRLKNGQQLAIIATGTNLVADSLKAADIIYEKCGIEITVTNIHTLNPIDEEEIIYLASSHDTLITVEEHFINGGLGSAVSEIVASFKNNCQLIRLGIVNINLKAGSRSYMLNQCGLNKDGITNAALCALNVKIGN